MYKITDEKTHKDLDLLMFYLFCKLVNKNLKQSCCNLN